LRGYWQSRAGEIGQNATPELWSLQSRGVHRTFKCGVEKLVCNEFHAVTIVEIHVIDIGSFLRMIGSSFDFL
jgi:hypothetical protein